MTELIQTDDLYKVAFFGGFAQSYIRSFKDISASRFNFDHIADAGINACLDGVAVLSLIHNFAIIRPIDPINATISVVFAGFFIMKDINFFRSGAVSRVVKPIIEDARYNRAYSDNYNEIHRSTRGAERKVEEIQKAAKTKTNKEFGRNALDS